MARTFVQPGDVVTFTAPAGGVTAGTPVLIGSLLVIPQNTASQGAEFEGMAVGVHRLSKTSAQSWAEGDKVYWNTSTDLADNVATTGPLIGVALAVADNPSSSGVVRLNGAAPDASEGPQAAIADLVAISGGEAPSEAEHNLIVTKVNAILAVLRTVGVIAAS